MNLCLVTPRYWEQDLRGGEEVIKTLARNLSKSHQVNVVASTSLDITSQSSPNGTKDSPGMEVVNELLRIHRVNPNPYVSFALHKANDLFSRISVEKPDVYSYYLIDLIRTYGWGPYLIGFRNLIKTLKPDLIHSSLFPTTSSYQAMKASHKLNIPFVFTPYFHFNVNTFKRSTIIKKVMEQSDSIVACTNQEKQAITKLGISGEKTHVIPLSFDVGRIEQHKVSQETAKQTFGFGDRFVILTHPWSGKGAITLLRAVSGMKSRREVVIVSIGIPDGAYVDEKEKLLREKTNVSVHDLGWVNGDLKWLAFYSCDVFALPSFNDAFGLSYLNAWAAEKPVIAAKTSAVDEIVEDEKDGFLVNVANIEAFSELLDNLAGNESYLKELGKNGRTKLIRDYNEDLMVRRYEQLFADSIKKS